MEDPLHSKALAVHHILDLESPLQIAFLEQTAPFRLLISVILSAQTTDRQVNLVASELFSRYPNPAELAKADIEEVKSIIRSTGYYSTKAAHIIGTAQHLEQYFNSQVPLSMEELTTLPGVGRKTASCIIGQIAGQPAIIVDTHFGRVVRRLGLTTSNNAEQVEREIAALLPPETHYRFSMTVNLHGRTTCHARQPKCAQCSLAPYCDSYPIT